VVLFGLGAARWAWAQPTIDASFIAYYNDSGEATLEGYVIDEPDARDTYVNLRVAVDTLLADSSDAAIPVSGIVLAQVPRIPQINYGDRIRVQGDLRQPPTYEDFDYADYLARQGVYSILRRARASVIDGGEPPWQLQWQFVIFRPIYTVKGAALAAITRTFPEPQGSLLSGILLGVDANVPPSLQEAFRTTGTTHILAISGFNVSIIAGLFTKIFQRVLGQKQAIPVTIAAIAAYTVLAGADASVVRAAVMGSLVLLSGGFHRPSNGLASLAAAAFIMTLYNPGTAWDVGFQLSVAATLGLILYAEPLTQAAIRFLARFMSPKTVERVVGLVGEFSLLTVAAQITTLPLIAYYFRQISVISLVANLLVLPVQPAVMILGGIATLGAMINTTLGYWLYWLAWPFVAFTIVVVEALAKVPLAAIPIDQFSIGALFGMYAALFGLTWFYSREPEQRPKWLPAMSSWAQTLGLAGLAIGTLAAWNVYLHQPDGRLHVTFLNVGHGDAILIQTPTGRYALIDGGPSPNALAEALGRHLPATARRLDLVIAASPETDSLSGLPGLLGRYDIGQVVMAGEPQTNSAYREWVGGLSSHAISVTAAEPGLQVDLGDGAVLSVVANSRRGAVFRLDYRNASFLIPAGMDAVVATELATSGSILPATVLLAPRHGGEKSISALFMDAVQPSAIVIAVEAGNAAGDPHPATLDLFTGRTVLRTDKNGTIGFATDGQQLWVEAER
ncbi:MAG: DUF4131 domain-containing protein, partial [Chloroflexi bacterium]|nr:DUF4131 domain-containing protein [Chloroflexota bacterium]